MLKNRWQGKYGECSNEILNVYLKKVEDILPKDFIETIKLYNGGFPEKNIFSYIEPETSLEVRSCLGNLISFDSSHQDNMLSYIENPPEGLPSKMLPFALVGNGNLICFNIEAPQGKVYLWLHGNMVGKDFCVLAESYNQFISSLIYDEDEQDDDILDLDNELAELD